MDFLTLTGPFGSGSSEGVDEGPLDFKSLEGLAQRSAASTIAVTSERRVLASGERARAPASCAPSRGRSRDGDLTRVTEG